MKYLKLSLILFLILLVSDCGKKGTENSDSSYSCDGSLSQCLKLKSGWILDRKITDVIIVDPSVVKLQDGRFRIYGNDLSQGIRHVISLISNDEGITFTAEPGYRMTGDAEHDAFFPDVIVLPDGKFRMYLTDQRTYVGSTGAPAFISAISDDGLNFTWEDGNRLTYSGTGDEASGIRNQNVVILSDGRYRMYYNANHKALSAISSDGLTFQRESGVRYDPVSICPAYTGAVNPKLYLDKEGVFHMFTAQSACDDLNHTNEVTGIFEGTSTNGLNFTFSTTPVVQGYFIRRLYTGNPSDPFENPEDPILVLTPAGLRMYFNCVSPIASAEDSGYFSVYNTGIR